MAEKAKQFSLEEIQGMLDSMGLEVTKKHTPSSTTLTAPTLHGPFHGASTQLGIFATPGVRPERFTTLARPPASFVKALPVGRSIFTKERLEVMTGVTAASGTNATGWCADPPTVGQGKVCQIDYNWGEYYVRSQLHAIPLTGQRYDRADVPATILNQSPEMHPYIPSAMWVLEDRQPRYAMFLVGVAADRSMDIVLFQGNNTLASTNTNHGFISEPEGLDRLIKTGYTDARTGLACPAVDSAIVSFNADVASTMSDGRNVVQAMSDLYWGLKDRASKFGMEGTIWGIAMRPEMFRPLIENWVCQYYTYRCTSTNAPNANLVEIMHETNDLRLQMLQGQYLLIDGEPVPVFLSEGIVRDVLGNQHYKSDTYVVPLSWNGMPLTHVEFFPMDNPEATELSSLSAIERSVLNNGMWLVSSEDTAMCTELHFAAKYRIILETPFLAGRLDDVSYTFRAPTRAAQPGDTFNYADGGKTYNTPWDS